MHPVQEDLITSERIWREIVLVEEPMFSRTPVRRADPDPNARRPWSFSTNNNEIKALVFKPDVIQKTFEEVVADLYQKSYGFQVDDQDKARFVRNLIQDTFTYLFFHELFHPLYCPDSADDRKKVAAALYRGIRKAEPHLSDRDVNNKIGNARNAVWDFLIDDIFFYLSNFNNKLERRIAMEFERRNKGIGAHKIKELPDGVIGTWDVVELAGKEPNSLFYPVTRAMYSLLFTRGGELRANLFDYFRQKMGARISDATLEQVIKESLNGIIKHLDVDDLRKHRINPKRFRDYVDELYDDPKQTSDQAHAYLIDKITKVFFDKTTRYKSIEGFIAPLSKFISTTKEEDRHGSQLGDGSETDDAQTDPNQPGGGAEESLQDLVDEMGDEASDEISSFLLGIANDNNNPRTDRNKRLSNLAKDLYYKRNARPLPIQSPRLEAVSVELGKVRRPVKVESHFLTNAELMNLPWDKIHDFFSQTGISQVTRLTPYQYRYDVYEWEEIPIEDFQFEKSGLELPDNVVFHFDTSGSMLQDGNGKPGMIYGSGCRFDALCNVAYGIVKTLLNAAREMNKNPNVVVVNYSNAGHTVVSDAIDLETFYETPNNNPKQIMLNPQGGSTYYDIPAYQLAQSRCVPGKTVHIFVADGDLDNDHDANMKEIQKLAAHPNTSILYFAMFHKGMFAQRVERFADTLPNVNFYHFSHFSQLQSAATNVLIEYSEASRTRH